MEGVDRQLEEFKELVSQKHAPGEAVSVKSARRKGFRSQLYGLSRLLGCTEGEVLKQAGFKTYAEENYTTESSLRKELQDYYRGKKRVVIRDLVLNRHGARHLYGKLRRFAGKKFGIKRASLALEHFGYRTNIPPKKTEGVEDALRALWPEDKVREVYQGDGTLTHVGQLKKINTRLYYTIKDRGIVATINSLYEEYPDLYTYVRAPQSPVAPADPEIVARQLRNKFFSGQSIGPGLLKSPDKNERLLGRRVLSLAPGELWDPGKAKPYVQVVRQLLPEVSATDIKASPGAFYATGTIGNLFLHWLLKWTLAMNPTGDFYHDGFSRIFSTPLQDLYAEKRIKTNDRILAPDFLVVGTKNTAVEVKTGEHLETPRQLYTKYNPGQQYLWDINGVVYPMERKVAVLHMRPEVVKAAGSRLVDSGFTVVGGEQFLSYLERFIELISQSPWDQHLANAAPRLHNLASIIDFYKKLAFKPAMMNRSNQREAVNFAKGVLEDLVEYEIA